MTLARRLKAATAVYPSISYIGSYTDPTSASSWTIPVSFGTPRASRKIVVVATANGGAASFSPTITIDGVTATLVVSDTSDSMPVLVGYAALPNPFSGNVTVTFSTSFFSGVKIAVYALYDAPVGPSVAQFNSNSPTPGTSIGTTLSVPASAVALCAGISNSLTTATWSGGIAEDSDIGGLTTASRAAGSALAATPTVTWGTSTLAKIVALTWR